MLKRFGFLLIGMFTIGACSANSNDHASVAASAPNAAAATNAAASAPSATSNLRTWQEGVDYKTITPAVATSSGDKIEVVEVFSYACPHCAFFQSYVEQLKSKLPANAQLVLLPAVFNAGWEPFARAFYTAKSLGVLDKTHQALFDALHRDHLPLGNLQALANGFYASQGVSAASFISTADSFVIDGQIAHGNQLVQQYGISSTPTLVVNGKYRVEMDNERKLGPQEVVDIALYLVKQELAHGKSAK